MSIVTKKNEDDGIKYTVTIERWAGVWVKAIAGVLRANGYHISGALTFEEQAGEILEDLLAAGWIAPNSPSESG